MGRASRRSHARFRFVSDLAKSSTVQSRSGLPILAKYKHFNTIWEATLWQLSHNFQIFWFYLVIILTRVGKTVKLVSRLVRQFAFAFKTLLSVTFRVAAPSCDAFRIFLFGFDICACADQFENDYCFSVTSLLLTCAARWVQPRYTWSVNVIGSTKSTCFSNFAHIFGHVLSFFHAIFMSSTYTAVCDLESTDICHPSSISTLSKSPANGWPWRLRSSGAAGSLMLWSSCFRYSEPVCWTTILRKDEKVLVRLSFRLGCVRSPACAEQPGNVQITSKKFARRHL